MDDWLKGENFAFLVSKAVGHSKAGVSILEPAILRKDIFQIYFIGDKKIAFL